MTGTDFVRFPCCGGGADSRDHDSRCVVGGDSDPAPAHRAPAVALPTEAKARKAIPIVAGCLDYFPAALAAVAELSRVGNEQHSPGQPMHHARGKSGDHADCIGRHLMDRGTVDTDGIRHSAKVAWRALALLQEELEREAGAPLARGAKLPPESDSRPTPPAYSPPARHTVECRDPKCEQRCMEPQPSIFVAPEVPTARLRCGDCGKTWPMDERSTCPECHP